MGDNENVTKERPGSWASLRAALTSWRTASVTLLSFSSGLPLGIVWFAIPDQMRKLDVDIRLIGLLTLAQAPWTLKFLWAPLMDRYFPPFWGRRRGWAALMQVALLLATVALATVGADASAFWVIFALSLVIAIAGASQDIAIDAYAVEVLRPEEHGPAVGARTALYRAAMTLSGRLHIFITSLIGWRWTALIQSTLYLPMLLVSGKAPEPESPPKAPQTMRQAVWLPFLECLSRHRALEILAFVMLYKLADALSQSLLSPFLVDMGYSAVDRGLVLGTVGVWVTILGTFAGGFACSWMGVGHSLWVFGLLQIFSNIGYVAITYAPGSRPMFYGAMFFEMITTGLGMGAFGVMLLRITRKQFSATQYALFSSLFGLPRILAGPVTGFVVDAAGWRFFFYLTMVAGIPGLLLLQRFSPIGVRDPEFQVTEEWGPVRPLTPRELAARGVLGGLLGFIGAVLISGTLAALKALRSGDADAFELMAQVHALLTPVTAAGGIKLFLLVVVGLILGLFTAAIFAARHGAARQLALDADDERGDRGAS